MWGFSSFLTDGTDAALGVVVGLRANNSREDCVCVCMCMREREREREKEREKETEKASNYE